MSPDRARRYRLGDSFPRVSGDEPAIDPDRAAKYLFSPRERG